jgi:L-iditol 2-dehydrogenase
MKTAGLVITAPGRAELQELQVPVPVGDHVVVRVELCGVCTPEQRVFRGARPQYPYWGGHELCGIVEQVCSDRQGLPEPGTRVALGLMPRCGRCEACRRGLDNHCAYVNRAAPTDGLPAGPRGFADRVAVEPYQVISLPAPLRPERVALTEPLACCLHSVHKAAPEVGETAVVLGAGTMGLLHTVLLSQAGCRVLVLDDDPDALSRAQAAGAAWTGPLTPQALAAVLELTGGWGAEMVFCSRGGDLGLQLAARLAARAARVVLFQSYPSGAELAHFAPEDVHYREVRLMGSIAQTLDDLRGAAEILALDPDRFDCLHIEVLPCGERALARSLAPDLDRVLLDFRSV